MKALQCIDKTSRTHTMGPLAIYPMTDFVSMDCWDKTSAS